MNGVIKDWLRGFWGDCRTGVEGFEVVSELYGVVVDVGGLKGGVNGGEQEAEDLSVKRIAVGVVGRRWNGEEVESHVFAELNLDAHLVVHEVGAIRLENRDVGGVDGLCGVGHAEG